MESHILLCDGCQIILTKRLFKILTCKLQIMDIIFCNSVTGKLDRQFLEGSTDFQYISQILLCNPCNPIGTIFSAIFISHISVGGSFLSTKYYPTEISDLISGIIIYLCAFSMLFRGKIHALLFKNADKTNVNAEPAAPAKSATEKEGK